MTYRLVYIDSYVRRAKKFIKRHPQILGQYEKTLQLLEFNPRHHGSAGVVSPRFAQVFTAAAARSQSRE